MPMNLPFQVEMGLAGLAMEKDQRSSNGAELRGCSWMLRLDPCSRADPKQFRNVWSVLTSHRMEKVCVSMLAHLHNRDHQWIISSLSWGAGLWNAPLTFACLGNTWWNQATDSFFWALPCSPMSPARSDLSRLSPGWFLVCQKRLTGFWGQPTSLAGGDLVHLAVLA